MSRFFSEKYNRLTPYTPGEQPKDMKYIKLNTNESPFPPSSRAAELSCAAARTLMLYPDPECTALHSAFASLVGVSPTEVLAGNGSDEILNFAFMAFCDKDTPAVFPDITYGFYSVFAKINGVPYEELELCDDFTIDTEDYVGVNKTVFLANPNAPTGIALPASEIEKILRSNPDNVVVVDEAYVDFGAESCIPLIRKFDNLLIVQTFSKSRSMAGARLGFAIGCEDLIRDLNTIKYSTNPYNINRMTMAAGIGVIEDDGYTRSNVDTIIKNREYATKRLRDLGFYTTDSAANFIFARHEAIGGFELYAKLKEKGILVRHFGAERLRDYNRITVGSKAEMCSLCDAIEAIIKEKKG